MVGPKYLIANGEAALVELFGLCGAAHVLVQQSQVVERTGDTGVVGPKRFFIDRYPWT
jgi:hypothetical protein